MPNSAAVQVTVKELAARLGGEAFGAVDAVLYGISPIESAKPGQLSFLANPRYVHWLEQTAATAILISARYRNRIGTGIVCREPYLALSEAIDIFYPSPVELSTIAPSAVIARSAVLGRDLSIGPVAVIGEHVRIGDRTVIHPGVVIGAGSELGCDVVLHPQVTLYPGVSIGDRVVVHSGTVIGADGFGYVWDGEKQRKIRQVGGVRIGSDSEIGANVTIDRGAIGDTIIGQGVRIDNLVQVAHNVVIGDHTLVVAQVGIAGSAQIGTRVALGAKTGILGHIRIGDQVQIGAMSGVGEDLPAGSRYSGIPAIPHRSWLKSVLVFRDLPKLWRTLQQASGKAPRGTVTKAGRQKKAIPSRVTMRGMKKRTR